MQVCEVWKGISDSLHHQILESAYLRNKKLYRLFCENAAKQLRMRVPKFLEIPRNQRHGQAKPFFSFAGFDILGQNLATNWLFYEKQPMMIAFLDGLGIAHDGTGCVDAFPEQVDDEKLKKAVKDLYEKFDKEHVAVYLQLFPLIAGCHWPALPGLAVEQTSIAC